MGLREHNKKEHLMGAMFASLIWPIWIPLHFLVRHMLGKVPPTTKELQQQIKERDQRILKLERELDVK